jgi:hypothetical protein
MVATHEAVDEVAGRLEQCRRRQDEVWPDFARDYDQKSELVASLVRLAFSLSTGQVTQMEQSHGVPAASLRADQQSLLDRAEPLARGLGFLAHTQGATFAESSIEVLATGSFGFAWEFGKDRRARLSINWLPYSLCDHESKERLAPALARWQDRQEWLIGQHYADFRQAADCCRLLFLLALSLSPEQVAAVAGPPGVQVAALWSEQRALLEAAIRLGPPPAPRVVDDETIQFQPDGQFWLTHRHGDQASDYGMGWLPHAWSQEKATQGA